MRVKLLLICNIQQDHIHSITPLAHCVSTSTKSKSVTSSTNNSSLDISRSKQGILIRNSISGKSSLRSIISTVSQIHIISIGIASRVRIVGRDGFLRVDKDRAFDEYLGALASVYARGEDVVVVAVDDVDGAEADRGGA